VIETRGVLIDYTGDGKGKTTAAFGLALRAVGHGRRVKVVQFLKGATNYGETMYFANHPLVEVIQTGTLDFVNPDSPLPIDLSEAARGMEIAKRIIGEGSCDLLILDELNVALFFRLVRLEDVLGLLAKRPAGMDVVITGRKAPQELLEICDTVTEMREVKHHYHSGIEAREGMEF
jgi:cob(I)alamin adenosyltransferase